MSLTLAQFKDFTDDEFSPVVIQELRKKSPLLEILPFTSNGVNMQDRWTYGYKRDSSLRSADTRLVNTEYVPEIILAPQRFYTDLSIFGGSFTLDRVMGRDNAALARQFNALVTATTRKAADLSINGDASTAGEFDGLDALLAGSAQEYGVDTVLDLSDMDAVNAAVDAVDYMMAEFVALLGRTPDAFFTNGRLEPKLSYLINKWGERTRTSDEFGRQFNGYRGIPFIDLGDKPGSSDPVIPVETRTVGGVEYTGLTDLYAVCFGDQELHGVSPDDKSRLVRAFEPNFERPGAVHLGECEVVMTLALESESAAAVWRNIKVAA